MLSPLQWFPFSKDSAIQPLRQPSNRGVRLDTSLSATPMLNPPYVPPKLGQFSLQPHNIQSKQSFDRLDYITAQLFSCPL